jgi:hypothetical protein
VNVPVLILLCIAGLLAILDLVLVHTATGRRYFLLPVAVLLIVAASLLTGAGIGN